MRRALPLFAFALLACSDDPYSEVTAPVIATDALSLDAGEAGNNFITQLAGSEEVPARATDAHGVASFRLSKDGLSVDYTLNVAEIRNVVAAHIHIAPAGSNGSVVVWLAGPFDVAGGASNGNLSRGTFTAADLVGPLAGQPLSALLDAIAAGNAYVNVHTNDGVSPTNTGPGDFPGGEVRGQLDTGSLFRP